MNQTNWRSELDIKYNQKEYDQLLHNSQRIDLSQLNSAGSTIFANEYEDAHDISLIKDCIRFPPYGKIQLPDEMNAENYSSSSFIANSTGTLTNSAIHEDREADHNLLEGLFQTMIEKAVSNRKSTLEHGRYIHSITNPLSDNDKEYMKSTIADNMATLKEECLQLVKEMQTFQIATNDSNRHPLLLPEFFTERNQLLMERVNSLKSAIVETAIVLDNLQHYSSTLIYYPSHPICPLDGIRIDWSKKQKIEKKIQSSNRSINFATCMIAHGFPVCNAIYRYMQSPTDGYSHLLAILDYTFQPKEFGFILKYLKLQHSMAIHEGNQELSYDIHIPFYTPTPVIPKISIFQSIHQLILHDCQLGDKDCHQLANYLPFMPHLQSLILTSNHITSSGLSSLFMSVWESTQLNRWKILRLDNNSIGKKGILSLVEIFPKLLYLEVLSLSNNPIGDIGLYYILCSCLNPYRKTFLSLAPPKPFQVTTNPNQDKKRMMTSQEEEGEDSNSDDQSEKDDESDEEINEILADDPIEPILGEKDQISSKQKRKTQRHCYYSNYFQTWERFIQKRIDKYRFEKQTYRQYSYSIRKSASSQHPATDSYDEGSGGYSTDSDEEEDSNDGYDGKLVQPVGMYGTRRSIIVTRKKKLMHRPDQEQFDWIEESEEDDFMMEIKSNYSSSNDGEEVDQAVPTHPRERHPDVEPRQVVLQLLRKERVDSIQVFTKHGHYRCQLLLLFIKHRIKLAAISMFLTLRHHGHSLSCLMVAGCELSPSSLTTLACTLPDLHHLTLLDLSHNPLLFHPSKREQSNQEMVKLIQLGHLKTLKLNGCDLGDEEVMNIVKTINLSAPTTSDVMDSNLDSLQHGLESIELSQNNIGPTGANWIASASKLYYADILDFDTKGYHKKAPELRKSMEKGENPNELRRILGSRVKMNPALRDDDELYGDEDEEAVEETNEDEELSGLEEMDSHNEEDNEMKSNISGGGGGGRGPSGQKKSSIFSFSSSTGNSLISSMASITSKTKSSEKSKKNRHDQHHHHSISSGTFGEKSVEPISNVRRNRKDSSQTIFTSDRRPTAGKEKDQARKSKYEENKNDKETMTRRGLL